MTDRAFPLAGLVLAGGRSSRMGQDKAFIELDGEPLLRRQIRTLTATGVGRGDVLVSLRRDQPAPSDRRVTVVHDRVDGRGPLAGVVAAMRLVPDRHLLVLAVDMPTVTPELLRGLLATCDESTGAAHRIEAIREPLCAIYPPGSLAFALRHLEGPGRSPSALVAELLDAGRMREHPLSRTEGLPLSSWNRPGDLNGTATGRGI